MSCSWLRAWKPKADDLNWNFWPPSLPYYMVKFSRFWAWFDAADSSHHMLRTIAILCSNSFKRMWFCGSSICLQLFYIWCFGTFVPETKLHLIATEWSSHVWGFLFRPDCNRCITSIHSCVFSDRTCQLMGWLLALRPCLLLDGTWRRDARSSKSMHLRCNKLWELLPWQLRHHCRFDLDAEFWNCWLGGSVEGLMMTHTHTHTMKHDYITF